MILLAHQLDYSTFLNDITVWFEQNFRGVRWHGDEAEALCPFHDDHNPSFSFNRRKGVWKCWAGCGSGGLKDLASRLGVSLPDCLTRKGQSAPQRQRRRVVATYDYVDEQGNLVFQVLRYDPKDFRQRRPCPKGGDCGATNTAGKPICRQDRDGSWWHWNLDGVRRVPYRLPEVIQAVKDGKQIFVVEGEKDADNLAALGLAATTSPQGAGKWPDDPGFNECFQGATAVILPDNDAPGYQHAQKVARILTGVAESVKIIKLPDLPPKGDVSDWLAAGHSKDELFALVEATPAWQPTVATGAPVSDSEETVSDEETNKKRESQAALLIKLATDAELFHTPDGDCYATIAVDNHKEIYLIKSKNFRRWLMRRFYEDQSKPPGSQALQDALGVLEAKAMFDGQELPVYLRLAGKDDAIYLDLCNENWQAVEITPAGWQLTKEPPVKFRRAKGMLPLPAPESGGSIDELRPFVNVADESSWRLVVAWLLAALRPAGPYPVLLLQGEQGTAKSTTAKVLRSLIDPSTAPLRTAPREERDLMIAANNGWTLAFDNLSGIPAWLSDAICRLATGGGFSTRELYSDADEVLFDAMRPISLNGIDDLASRHDLLDRALVLNLPAIPETQRRDIAGFWRDFEQARPRILGALLDAISAGLRNIDKVKLDRLPRMADFAKWVTACEEALPWPPGGFMEAYTGNRTEAVELALEADPVAMAVRALLAKEGSWQGTASELLVVLQKYVLEQTRNTKAWPRSPKALSGRLRRAATFLRQTGIEVGFFRDTNLSRTRLIRLGMQTCVQTVQTVQENPQSFAPQGFSGWTQNMDNWTQNKDVSRFASKDEALQDKTLDDMDISDGKIPIYSRDDDGEPW